MRVAVNCAIATRGISGSTQGLVHILRTLRKRTDLEIVETWPRHGLRHNRLWNAAIQATWDLYSAAHTVPSADVLISPCNIGHAAGQQHHVLVLHDTMVLDRPDLYDSGYAAYARVLFGLSVRAADVILVPSHYTRGRLLDRWINAPTVLIAPWPLSVVDGPRDISLDTKNIVMVGSTMPHKRQAIGIAAVEIARRVSGEDLRLTIVGPKGSAEGDVLSALQASDPQRRWTKRVMNAPDAELQSIYANAWLLLQPSCMEGYGLPVGEAASRGIPVIHSGQGALSEVAPRAVSHQEDPSSYADEICALLDRDAYSTAVSESLSAARHHTEDNFASVVNRALTPS
jgi:glycosyltransferase involved in cell wall biosynthesis